MSPEYNSPSYVTLILVVYADPLNGLVAEDDGKAKAGGLHETCRQAFSEHAQAFLLPEYTARVQHAVQSLYLQSGANYVQRVRHYRRSEAGHHASDWLHQ